jgi:hypothetical protein
VERHVASVRPEQAAREEDHREGGSSSTRNKYLQLSHNLSKCGVKQGYLKTSWFVADSELHRETERSARRDRRLQPDTLTDNGTVIAGEERRLLAVAPSRLQRLIIAALETCCRRGELLALQADRKAGKVCNPLANGDGETAAGETESDRADAPKPLLH